MNKYARLKCDIQGVYPNWFLVYEGGDLPTEIMKEKLIRSVFNLHSEDNQNDWHLRMIKAATNKVDYTAIYQRRKQPLYIRENGVYMFLGSRASVIEEVESPHFPVEKPADIVICENDKQEEFEWKNYLLQRFPDKSIKTINFFDLRTDEDVIENFKGAEYITFSTTFSNMDWFEKLLRCKSENQKIVGYCHSSEKWEEAKRILNGKAELEIVTNPTK